MGIDITLHSEIKINSQWHHCQHIWVRRHYNLFVKMGAWERDDIKPITKDLAGRYRF